MNKVRFGVVGLGNMGSFHVKYLTEGMDNASLGAICDTDPAKLEKFAKETGVPAFADYRQMLASGKIDAVIIATPHYQHPDIAIDAFEKGLHVLCEKPVAVMVGQARRLNEAYKKHPNLKFGIMFQMRTNAIFAKLREVIASGELGEITRLTWVATNWFRTWTYYASGGWRATWAGEGGGVLINQCPHNIDQILWLTGLTAKRVTGVASIAKTHPIEVEDEVSAIIEFTNGAVGHFITTTGEAPGTDRLEIAGDRGKIVAEHGKLTFARTVKPVQEFNRTSPESFASMETWEIDVPVPKNKPQGHKVVTSNFADAVLKDTPLLSPGVDGLPALELGNAMLMAGLTRKPVEIPMDAAAYEAFIKDLTQKYGGKKQLQGTKAGGVDMAASFH